MGQVDGLPSCAPQPATVPTGPRLRHPHPCVPGTGRDQALHGRARQPEAVFDLARGSPLPGPPRTRGRGRRPGRRAGELLVWGCRAGRSTTRSPRAAHAPGCVGSRTRLLRPPRRCGERVALHLPGGRPGHWAGRRLTLTIIGTSAAATGPGAPPLPGGRGVPRRGGPGRHRPADQAGHQIPLAPWQPAALTSTNPYRSVRPPGLHGHIAALGPAGPKVRWTGVLWPLTLRPARRSLAAQARWQGG